ncbi:MAG: exosome complex RNA-binding protein Rrp4 [Candidatus Pacearchaeota archaeon]
MEQEMEKNIHEDYDEKEREIITPGETIISGPDYLPGEGTRREGNEIVAERFGLIEHSGKLIKVIPLSGVFIPRRGNVIIGQVTDISFNGWMADINAPQSSFLPLSEVPRYIDKNNITEFLDIGDFFSAKINTIKQKGIDLTLDSKGLGKLEGGMIIFINPNKVPRVIGKAGSMIKLIKDETNSRITVGQNGLVWIRADKVEDELLAKKAIMFVAENSFISGLTEKVSKFLKDEKEKI